MGRFCQVWWADGDATSVGTHTGLCVRGCWPRGFFLLRFATVFSEERGPGGIRVGGGISMGDLVGR